MSEVKTVRLGALDHDPISIAGHEGRLKTLDDLKAQLPVSGQLQSLKVRPAGKGKAKAKGVEYWVTAGNRRLASFRALRDAGAEIKGVKVTDDFPVHVIVGNENDAEAHTAMVAENVQRLAPTPMEEARDFAEMVKRASPKEIALQFGVKPRYVEQRLKLAGLHPDVQAALERGVISLEAAEAFTVEPDSDRQAAYLASAVASGRAWDLRADRVKAAFTEELIASDSPAAKLIGKAAYVKAGGVVMADSFGDRAYWISNDVIHSLLDAHWEEKRKAWLAEGWAWVADAAEYKESSYGQLHYSGLTSERGAGEGGAYTAEQKAYCGVVYWRDGGYEPKFGWIDEAKAANPNKKPEPKTEKPPATLDDPGNSVIQNLTERLTAAAQLKVRAAPQLALPLLVATLHFQVYGKQFAYQACAVHVTANSAPKGAASPYPEAGTTLDEALTWAGQQPVEVLLAYLGDLLAPSIGLRQGYAGDDPATKRAIAEFLDPAIGSQFDPADFFASVPKALIQLAYREMTGSGLIDTKKAEMAACAAEKAKETGWLPPQLRMPSYTGPAKANPLAGKVKGVEKAGSDASPETETLQAAE